MKLKNFLLLFLVVLLACDDEEDTGNIPNFETSTSAIQKSFFAENVQKFVNGNDGIFSNNNTGACSLSEILFGNISLTTDQVFYYKFPVYSDFERRYFHNIYFAFLENEEYTYFFGLTLFSLGEELLDGVYRSLSYCNLYNCSTSNGLEIAIIKNGTREFIVYEFTNVLTTINWENDYYFNVKIESDALLNVDSFSNFFSFKLPENVPFKAEFCLNELVNN